MSNKIIVSSYTLYEILTKISQCATLDEKEDMLRDFDSLNLRRYFELCYSPDIRFSVTINKGDYEAIDIDSGYAPRNLLTLMRGIYKLSDNGPYNYDSKRRIIINILNSISKDEADIFVAMLKKKVGVKGISRHLLKRVYGDIEWLQTKKETNS